MKIITFVVNHKESHERDDTLTDEEVEFTASSSRSQEATSDDDEPVLISKTKAASGKGATGLYIPDRDPTLNSPQRNLKASLFHCRCLRCCRWRI